MAAAIVSDTLRDALPYFGVRAAGATDRMIEQGRRRTATLLSILAFTLLVSAQGDEAWISGGFTITLNATRVAAPLPPAVSALCAECVAVKAAQPPPLGATFQRRFNVGLHAMSVEGSRHYDVTNVDSYQTCAYDLKDWINEYNSGVWSSKPISWTTVQSTQGLLIFGAILLGFTCLGLCAVLLEVPTVVNWKWSPLAFRVGSLASAFFILVGVMVYGTSNILSDFCDTFDSNGNAVGLPCFFGDAFNMAIAAGFFAALSSFVLWRYTASDFTSAVGAYEFKSGVSAGAFGSGDASAPLDGGASVSASFQGSSSTGGAGGYNGFGSGEL